MLLTVFPEPECLVQPGSCPPVRTPDTDRQRLRAGATGQHRPARPAAQTERARDRYAMARKYAGINVKTQEASTEPNIPNVKTSCCVNFSVSLVNLDA